MTTRSLIPLVGTLLAGMLTWLTLQGEEQLAAVVVLGFLTLCGLLLLALGWWLFLRHAPKPADFAPVYSGPPPPMIPPALTAQP